MANDVALRASLVWLAVIMVAVGICTQSMKKMMVTYMLGVAGIAGVLLPDWDYFNRDFSRWTSPVHAEEVDMDDASFFKRFAKSRVRLIAYTLLYGFSLYKWWDYVSG